MTININDNLSDKCFAEFLNLTHKLTGITIGDNRKSMLVSRLRTRLRATESPDFESYLEFLKKDSDEIVQFINSITTNKTLFFRTPRIWSYLSDIYIPEWINARNGRKFQVWSAAASTGEEAYTAGVLLESFRARYPSFDYQITGTDISSRVIKTAKAGVYSARSVQRFRDTESELFQAHMVGNDTDGYSVTPNIRGKIRFKEHNIFKPYKHTAKFDVALLRNVLIYFTKPDQEKAISNVERSLQSTGLLVIGESETLSPLNTQFSPAAPLIYRPAEKKAGKAA